MEFTPKQKKAIELHHSNILVSAAAGSGKTAVLTERIVEMVCDETHPVDIDRILVVTFTNAAAAEMRERISNAILNRLNNDGENENLQKQAALLHNAQITTIDSFCLFILRNNFQDIGLDPNFRIADEGELKLMKQDILKELLEEQFVKGEEDFYHCVEYFCPAGKESVLEEHLLDLYEHAMSDPFPEDFLEERKQDYHITSVEDLLHSKWGQFLYEYVGHMLRACVQKASECLSLCEQPDGPYMYGEIVEAEKERLEALLPLDNLVLLSERIPALTFDTLSTKKDDSVDKNIREKAKKLRNQYKNVVKNLTENYFSVPLITSVHKLQGCESAIKVLVDLCLIFKKRLDEKKREKKLLDFADMEHLALSILLCKDENKKIIPTKTACEYQDYFEEVLIDEYQDSNLVQEYLLWAVSKEQTGHYNRFMVGDVKQSIYRFRLARPELFLQKYNTYSVDEGNNVRIDLHQNFRSRKEVIDSVNTVFSHIMIKDLGGIVYDDAAALYEGAEYPPQDHCESELIIFEKPQNETVYNSKQVEAIGVAERIKELMKSFSVTDKKTHKLRPVQYRDIVVLLRSCNGLEEEFKTFFERAGIPTYVAGKTGYFQTQEIKDVLQFLKVLDNPMQDIPFYGVLKSIFGGFTEEEIADVKLTVKNKVLKQEQNGHTIKQFSLYECYVKYCDNDFLKPTEVSLALREKCSQFLQYIFIYRTYTSYMPIQELLQKLMDEFHYQEYVAALPAGSKRLKNVEMLLTKATSFEKNSYYGLYHFVRYMEQLEKYSVDYGEANTLDENADVVRIMTIHKSKGLEFPITIVAGLSKSFNIKETTQSMIIDMDMGIGVDYVNPDMRIKSKTIRKNVLATKMKLESLSEEIRVLYVAMTRPKEKLIMTATSVFPEEPDLEKEYTLGELLEANSFLDLLLPVFPNTIFKSLKDMSLDEVIEEADQVDRLAELSRADLIVNEAKLQLLEKRFTYSYPYNLEQLFTKTTVSELKKAALYEKEEATVELFEEEKHITPYIPDFMRESEEVLGTTRGSAMHKVMELIDFNNIYKNQSELQTAMEHFREEGRLPKEYYDIIIPGKIMTFLESDLAGRMERAARNHNLYREQPFVYGISADRLSTIDRKLPQDETVLIQGIVDAFFIEDDEIVLLDYKTDVIKEPQELVERYKIQLDYYEEAIESLMGKRVKEKILYSFYLSSCITAD